MLKKHYIFYAVALVIILLSLYVSDFFVKRLADEERTRVEIWAEATKAVELVQDEAAGLNLVLKILESNTTIPVILCDSLKNPVEHRNLDVEGEPSDEYLREIIAKFESANRVIPFEFNDGSRQYIYYDDSIILKQLQYMH